MDTVDMLVRFISKSLDIPVLAWKGQAGELKDFEKRHCLFPSRQQQITAENLEFLLGAMKPQIVYEWEVPLKLHLLMFLFEGVPVLVGPFAEIAWDEALFSRLLLEQGISADQLLTYKMYYCGYMLLSAQAVFQTIWAALEALRPDLPEYARRVLYGLPGGDESHHYNTPEALARIEERYRRENVFLQCVAHGNTQGALEAMRKMGEDNVVDFKSANYQAMAANVTSVRTMLRKTAERMGVHVAVVDAISLDFAQRTYASATRHALSQIAKEQIVAFCEAIRKVREDALPVFSRRAVDYISLCMAEPLTVPKIAEALGISPGYLSHRFREETGFTVTQYIAKIRCTKAAELLLSSDYPVQDVCQNVGFLDNNYFVKVFKVQYGMTPTEFRQKGR